MYRIHCFYKDQKLLLLTAVLGLAGCQLPKAVTAPQPLPSTSSAAPVHATYQVEQIADGDTVVVDTDSYGRKVAEVRLLDDTLVQEVLALEVGGSLKLGLECRG